MDKLYKEQKSVNKALWRHEGHSFQSWPSRLATLVTGLKHMEHLPAVTMNGLCSCSVTKASNEEIVSINALKLE